MSKTSIFGAVAALALFGGVGAAAADIVIGSFTFADNATADAVGETMGTFQTFRIRADGGFDIDVNPLERVMTDGDIDTGSFCQEPCTVLLKYTDNSAINGPGDDLILFEQGGSEVTDVTIYGTTLTLETFSTQDAIRDSQGGLLNIFAIELDDFGVAAGATVVSVLLDLRHDQSVVVQTPSSDPVDLFALNSVDVDIDPSVEIGDGSSVGEGSVIKKDSSIGNDADIGEDVTLNKNIIAGDGFEVGDQSVVHKDSEVGDNVVIGEDSTIGRNCFMGNNVDIGDNTTIGKNCNIGDIVMIGSNVVMGKNVTVASGQMIPNGAVIPANTTIP